MKCTPLRIFKVGRKEPKLNKNIQTRTSAVFISASLTFLPFSYWHWPLKPGLPYASYSFYVRQGDGLFSFWDTQVTWVWFCLFNRCEPPHSEWQWLEHFSVNPELLWEICHRAPENLIIIMIFKEVDTVESVCFCQFCLFDLYVQFPLKQNCHGR